MPRIVRRPTHAGSWYERDPAKLQRQIDAWMEQAKEYDSAVAADPSAQSSPVEMPRRNVVPSESRPLKAIIGPHAGYSYCGHVMAHAYGHIDASRVKRIFLLGPSHHVYSRRCFLSTADAYETPLGPLRIDKELVAELRGSGIFDDMPLSVDEAEHSLELHTSFIASVMKNAPHDFTLVPIMVGAISAESEREYARLLAPYFDESGNNNNLFIISTDFCHYGSRFNYEPFSGDADTDEGPIWRRIAQLDAEGMRLIEAGGDPASFRAYLSRTGNTICGRYPCSLLMATASASSQKNVSFGFRYYDQSSKVVDPRRDSSVSYASALVCVEE